MAQEDVKEVSEEQLSKGISLRTGRFSSVRVGPIARIESAVWSVAEARAGDELELRAGLRDVASTSQARFRIFSGASPATGRVLAELSAPCGDGQARASWKIPKDTAGAVPEIGDDTAPRSVPETAEPLGLRFEVSCGSASRLSEPLAVSRRIELDFDLAEDGSKLAGAPYLLVLADGSSRRGTLDGGGRLAEQNCPPGAFLVSIQGHPFARPLAWLRSSTNAS